jgi:hypothetical protein
MTHTDIYDIIIVGAGMAGLHLGVNILTKYPTLNCCILEKYNYVGGRVVTYTKTLPNIGKVQWENGAARISSLKHKRTMKLLSEYGLTFVPIDPDIDFIKNTNGILTGNNFTNLVNVYIKPLTMLPKEILATHTIKELLDKTIGSGQAKDFYIKFPYYSEIHTLRADIAIQSFMNEMGTNDNFGVCAEGLSTLANNLYDDFILLGGNLYTNVDLISVSKVDNYLVTSDILLDCMDRLMKKPLIYRAKTCVLALHSGALRNITGVNHLPILKHLRMTPLLRMYAVFPIRSGKSWFSGLRKIVTGERIRYILPVNPAKGIIMISYTDGYDADYWIKEFHKSGKYGEDNIKDLIMSEVRSLFPDRTIPDPLFFKMHIWYDGCTYWKPGDYNVEDESDKSLQPLSDSMSRLFMCGESFAVHQCWIESALEQAHKLFMNTHFRSTLREHERDNTHPK